jgi:hypothetical protein
METPIRVKLMAANKTAAESTSNAHLLWNLDDPHFLSGVPFNGISAKRIEQLLRVG